MKIEMLMPQMGESISEATVLKWHKLVGDKVEKDEILLEISTDKVDSEIPSPDTGVIVELRAAEGETVAVKSVIAVIDTVASQTETGQTGTGQTGTGQTGTVQAAAVHESVKQAERVSPVKDVESKEKRTSVTSVDSSNGVGNAALVSVASATDVVSRGAVPTSVEHDLLDEVSFVSPLAANLAREYHLTAADIASISGTGAQGRITKSDLLEFMARRMAGQAGSSGAAESRAGRSVKAPDKMEDMRATLAYDDQGVRREPLDKMRQLIAEHMVRSKATSPHVYTVQELDMTRVSKWRGAKQGEFTSREGFKLSFMPFFLEATVRALIKFPYINASVDGKELVLKRDVNLGCAVALGTTGLVVPVIRRADQLNFVGLGRSLNDIAKRARSKKLSPDELQGGTFTITNLGMFGSIIGCPIINQPQLAILGIGAVKKRPVVVDDMIAIREMCYLTLSYDHRVVDGSLAGQFLRSIVQYLEDWDDGRAL